MICLRCGHCCKYLWVIVVDDPARGLSEGNLIEHRGQGVSCKHFRQEPSGKYSCAIHDEPWYDETPCARHGQVERSAETPCRIGRRLLQSKIEAAIDAAEKGA